MHLLAEGTEAGSEGEPDVTAGGGPGFLSGDQEQIHHEDHVGQWLHH